MMNFTASGTSTPLTITGASSGGGEYIGLDNVSVVAPEPSQTAALGLGVLGLAGLALKAGRRKTIA
jgi:MYXO-CTERM domain-containing protein